MNSDELISYGRARFDHAAAKRLLKEKYQAKFLFAHAGGMWQAGPELLTTLKCCNGTVVILDMYENPVQINAEELYEMAIQRWQEQLNAWLTEHQEINKKR
jgi:hypothetical protein